MILRTLPTDFALSNMCVVGAGLEARHLTNHFGELLSLFEFCATFDGPNRFVTPVFLYSRVAYLEMRTTLT